MPAILDNKSAKTTLDTPATVLAESIDATVVKKLAGKKDVTARDIVAALRENSARCSLLADYLAQEGDGAGKRLGGAGGHDFDSQIRAMQSAVLSRKTVKFQA